MFPPYMLAYCSHIVLILNFFKFSDIVLSLILHFLLMYNKIFSAQSEAAAVLKVDDLIFHDTHLIKIQENTFQAREEPSVKVRFIVSRLAVFGIGIVLGHDARDPPALLYVKDLVKRHLAALRRPDKRQIFFHAFHACPPPYTS